jgi:hypothetical protein
MFAQTARRLNEKGARFQVLLAQDSLPTAPPAAPKLNVKTASSDSSGSASPTRSTTDKADKPHAELQLNIKPTAAAVLVGTPTVVVPTVTLNTFAANDFPLIIVTDHSGIVRAIQTAPENALAPGSVVDQIVHVVLELWPTPQESSAHSSH